MEDDDMIYEVSKKKSPVWLVKARIIYISAFVLGFLVGMAIFW